MRGLYAMSALLLGVALCGAPPAFATAIQSTGALPRGGSYILRSDPGVAQAAVELWFRAPSAGYSDDTVGVAQVAAAACAAAPLVGGSSLLDLVRTLGGQLTLNVYPDMVAVSVTVPAQSARRVVAAMTSAYFAPALTGDALKAAQRDAAVLAVERRYSADLTLHDALFAQLFRDGPGHYPTLPVGSEQTTKLSLDVVDAFAKRAFRSSNGILTLAGNIDGSTLAAVTDGGAGGVTDAPIDSPMAPAPQNASMEGAVAGVGLGWAGPSITDAKAATALDFVNDYLFRDETGSVQRALSRAGSADVVSGQFITLHNPGVMLVTIAGDDADAARTRVLAAISALEQPLDGATFEAARQAFLYHVASDSQTPQAMADNLGWYAAQGNAPYAPGDASQTYVRYANELEPAYVASVVQRYLRSAVIVRTIVHSKAPAS
jgi:predicted Zn-dependent peptidase